MQEGIKNGREIMQNRLLQERKNELEKTLKEGKSYVVCVTTKFEGRFSHFEQENGEEYVVFLQEGRTDRGSVPKRRVRVNQIFSTGLIKP